MNEGKKPKKQHNHDYRWTPKGPSNLIGLKLNPGQAWYRCNINGCGSMTLKAAPKRKSKFRKKK